MPNYKPPPTPNDGKDYKRTMSMMSIAQTYQKEKQRERRTSVDLGTSNKDSSPLFTSEPLATVPPKKLSSSPLPDKETIELVQSGSNKIVDIIK